MASPSPSPPYPPPPPSASKTVPSPPPLLLPPAVVSKVEENPREKVEEKADISHFNVEYIEKCRKYEADYTRRLMAKYFSKKNLYGDNIFDEKITIDNETIMSSRWPCTLSFSDPVKSFEERNNTGSTSTSET